MAWKIRGWNENYEDHKSRKLVKLPWFKESSRHDGYSYAQLMSREDGPAIYGVWAMLKKVAANTAIPYRGYLLRGSNLPHTTKTLAVLTRMPEPLIRTAIDALLDPEVGWLEEVELDTEQQPQSPAAKPASQPEPRKTAPEVYVDEFSERICARHPKKKTMSVQACGRLLNKIVEKAADPLKWLQHIDAHHAWRCEHEWADCEPRFVKSLAGWLEADPLAPIPDDDGRKEEPDYVERF